MALASIVQTQRNRLALGNGNPVLRQAGAMPYVVVEGRIAFLLITSRRTGRWIFPKGGPVEGLTPRETAMREAFEEGGVEGELADAPLGSYRTWKTSGIQRFSIEVDVYPLRVLRQFEEWPEQGQRRRHWALLPEAKRLLSEPRLAELAGMLSRRVGRQSEPATTLFSR